MITFEYFPNKRQCRIIGEKFDEIREHFSVKNDNAFFMRKFRGGFAPLEFIALHLQVYLSQDYFMIY